jgi:hypothetical protein
MGSDGRAFFEAIIDAGAILCGFCGTFLAFRIQREAGYYRQPALDFQSGKARDVDIGLTHFSSGFLLLLLGSATSGVFGFLVPLFALAGNTWLLSRPAIVVGGLTFSSVVIATYFCAELVHYKILSTRLANDRKEWGSEWPVVVVGLLVALALASAAWVLAT